MAARIAAVGRVTVSLRRSMMGLTALRSPNGLAPGHGFAVPDTALGYTRLMSGRASASPLLLAGLELGGTKCSCLIGTGPQDVRMHATVPTGSDPAATFAQIDAELRRGIEAHGPIHALGVA